MTLPHQATSTPSFSGCSSQWLSQTPNQTKLQVLGRSSDASTGACRAELSRWQLLRDGAGVCVLIAPDTYSFTLSLSLALGTLATYQRRNAETISPLFDLEPKPTDFLLMQTRFNIVDIFHVAVEDDAI